MREWLGMTKENRARKTDKKNFSHTMSFVKFMAAALRWR
jgi:hypothetical protein